MKYLIQQNHQPLRVKQSNLTYHMGYENSVIAQNVMQNLKPDPKCSLSRGYKAIATIYGVKLSCETNATMFIEKNRGFPLHQLNDGAFDIVTMDDAKFFNLLFKDVSIESRKGIIIPYRLVAEDEDDFVFRCKIIECAYNTTG
jgi:hypothetical protein